ncbi:GNAT family N-acetyltransferase [Fimbriimonas ginsengisoli]|uniref:GCN5-related N-acetyltransferase n=1 Tax=Fimbriimonas ginsengisoli Gsoil 348 TaxID=661478 RepID=A0A068NSM2_FIMGI|nr:GNAT family N-acetyltransferase [Fimbriimonas ginsengisoli]AIE86357.1 GCN5-related N-acetyltransferase [Fimbriimonas ginsengisoli Gsoil 348]
MIVVRKLRPQEWKVYKALRMESLSTDPQAFGALLSTTLERPDEYWAARLQDSLADSGHSLLFAMKEERPVGMVGCFPDEEPRTAYVISMYVTPSERGRGVSRLLMTSLLEELSENFDTAILDVNVLQTPAVSLYRSLGFQVYDEIDVTRSDGSTLREFRMRRTLKSPT